MSLRQPIPYHPSSATETPSITFVTRVKSTSERTRMIAHIHQYCAIDSPHREILLFDETTDEKADDEKADDTTTTSALPLRIIPVTPATSVMNDLNDQWHTITTDWIFYMDPCISSAFPWKSYYWFGQHETLLYLQSNQSTNIQSTDLKPMHVVYDYKRQTDTEKYYSSKVRCIQTAEWARWYTIWKPLSDELELGDLFSAAIRQMNMASTSATSVRVMNPGYLFPVFHYRQYKITKFDEYFVVMTDMTV